MANFPTSLDSLTNPTANDTLAAVPHHIQHGTANDILEALEAKVGIGASTPTKGKALKSTGTGTSTWQTTGHVNVLDHGAVGDDSTDCTAAFQSAVAAAISASVGVYVPSGVYRLSTGGVALDTADDLDVFGDGMSRSIIHFSEGTDASPKWAFYDSRTPDGTHTGRFTFNDLGFHGTWSDEVVRDGVSTIHGGGSAIYLTNIESLVLSRCRFYDQSSQGIAIRSAKHVTVIGCEIEQIAYDGVFTRGTFDQIIVGNRFRHVDDDVIALHQGGFEMGVTGLPREGIVVADNIMEDCKGMAMLGARLVRVHHNIMRRCKSVGIAIRADASAGDNTMFSVSVQDNSILDMVPYFSAGGVTPSWGIIVGGQTPTGGSETSNVVPGENNTGTGAFVRPFAYRNKRTSTSGASVPPIHRVIISGNEIARTLPAVANYSDWGYGESFERTGYTDREITDANMRLDTGVSLQGDGRWFRVSANVISHVGTGITMTLTRHFAAWASIISENIVTDFPNRGIYIAGAYTARLRIAGNQIDGDPYHDSANRGANGTWLANSLPTAIQVAGGGVSIVDNVVSNVGIAVNATATCSVTGTRLYGTRNSVGFHVTNTGIGNIPASSASYILYTTDSDPQSATYGAVTAVA